MSHMVTVFTDNKKVVAYISKQGGNMTSKIFPATWDILYRWRWNDIVLSASQIQGTAATSQVHYPTVWSMSIHTGIALFGIFYCPHIDLVSLADNAELLTLFEDIPSTNMGKRHLSHNIRREAGLRLPTVIPNSQISSSGCRTTMIPTLAESPWWCSSYTSSRLSTTCSVQRENLSPRLPVLQPDCITLIKCDLWSTRHFRKSCWYGTSSKKPSTTRNYVL